MLQNQIELNRARLKSYKKKKKIRVSEYSPRQQQQCSHLPTKQLPGGF